MPLIVYQIADVPLFHPIVGVDNNGLEISYTNSWRNPASTFTGTSGKHNYSDPSRPLVDNPQLSIRGTVMSTPTLSADAVTSRLRSAGGRVRTPVIAFRYQEAMPVNDICCTNADNPLDWLLTYGIITSIPKTAQLKSQDAQFTFQLQELELEMEIQTRWKRLTPFWWEYRKLEERPLNPMSPDNSQGGVDNYFFHPKRFSEFVSNSYFYKWNTTLSEYSPSFWGLKYAGALTGGVGSDYAAMGVTNVFSDPEKWSGQPTSVYAFTDLIPSGNIYIEVQKQTGYFAEQEITETSSLDLVQLNTDMVAAGWSGLYRTDIVICGYASPQPGFVIRNGNILSGVKPKWSYPGRYAGELGIGYNIVRTYSETSSGQCAYLHDFGAY